MTVTIRQDCYSSIKLEGGKIGAHPTHPVPLPCRLPRVRNALAAQSFPSFRVLPWVRDAPFNQVQSTAGALTVKLCKAPVPTGLGM